MKILNNKLFLLFFFIHFILSMYSSLSSHIHSDKGSILYYIWQFLSFPLLGSVGEFLVYDVKIINYELLFVLNSALWTLLLYLILRQYRQ